MSKRPVAVHRLEQPTLVIPQGVGEEDRVLSLLLIGPRLAEVEGVLLVLPGVFLWPESSSSCGVVFGDSSSSVVVLSVFVFVFFFSFSPSWFVLESRRASSLFGGGYVPTC